jgi:hypothetical protein
MASDPSAAEFIMSTRAESRVRRLVRKRLVNYSSMWKHFAFFFGPRSEGENEENAPEVM